MMTLPKTLFLVITSLALLYFGTSGQNQTALKVYFWNTGIGTAITVLSFFGVLRAASKRNETLWQIGAELAKDQWYLASIRHTYATVQIIWCAAFGLYWCAAAQVLCYVLGLRSRAVVLKALTLTPEYFRYSRY